MCSEEHTEERPGSRSQTRPVGTALQIATLAFVFDFWMIQVGGVPSEPAHSITSLILGSGVAVLLSPEFEGLGGFVGRVVE